MGRGIAPVLCATRLLVTGGGRKPRTCALGRSGVKSLPCERFDPLTPFPPTSGRTMIRGIPVLCTTQLVNGVVRRTAALGGKIPCERRNPSASFPVPSSGPSPIASSAHRCSCCCRRRSIRSQEPIHPHITLHLISPHNQYRGTHAFLLHLLVFTLLTLSISPGGAGHLRILSRAQETPSELPRWGCCKYLSSPGSTATLPEPSCWLVGRQERNAPSVLQPRRTDYWTTQPPQPFFVLQPTQTPCHTTRSWL